MNTTIESLAAHVRSLEEELRGAKSTLKAHHTNLENQAKGATPAVMAKLAMELPPLPASIFSILEDLTVSFATGSVVYGDPASAQDLDFVTREVPFAFQGYVLGDLYNAYETDKEVLYANYGGKCVNIICVGDELFETWRLATRVLRDLVQSSVAARQRITMDKWKRVRLFRALIDVFDNRTSIGGLLDLKSALEQRRCMRCGKEAINFMNQDNQARFETHGVCDRVSCSSIHPKARS